MRGVILRKLFLFAHLDQRLSAIYAREYGIERPSIETVGYDTNNGKTCIFVYRTYSTYLVDVMYSLEVSKPYSVYSSYVAN